MIIEKSPYYNRPKILHQNDLTKVKPEINEKTNTEKFSFMDWFKGLINPLQNLPLVSGIYSSINSETEESDRDLVQNSLGGFLYGGPIGAIAGFGNWVFNKIFDKTPTELVLDSTGISNIWKDDNEKQIAKNEIQVIEKNGQKNDKKLFIQLSSYEDKKSYFSNNTEIKPTTTVANERLFNVNKNAQQTVANNVIDSDKQKFKTPQNLNNNELNDPLLTSSLISNTEKDKIRKTETSKKFREINFSYPEWKPEKKVNNEKNLLDLKKKYHELGEAEVGKNFNLNI